MSQPIDPKVAAYAARIAEALSGLEQCDLPYGSYYISAVEIMFEGEASGVRVIPSDHGDLHIEFN